MRTFQKIFVITAITTFFALPQYLFAASTTQTLHQKAASSTHDTKPVKRWGRAFWRSALLPGWGQIKNGKSSLGFSIMGAFALNAVWYGLQSRAERDSFDQYIAAKSPSEAVDRWNNNRTQAMLNTISQWSLGLIYGGQLVEAVYDAPYDAPKPASKLTQDPRIELVAFSLEF